MKRQIETGEDGSLEPLTALFGEVADLAIVAKKKYIRKKCPHDKIKFDCRQCSPGNFCPHEKRKSGCRECTPKVICPHGKRYQNCRQCNPKIICPHGKWHRHCRECGGSSYCECGIRKEYCPKHGGSAMCIVCKLIQTSPKYDKHCVDCFVNYYPDDPRSDKKIKLKRRETIVREAIDSVFEGFIHDKAFSTGGCCPHRREIDHRITINGTVLAIETDEKAHISKDKQDEINRYDDLFVAFGAKFVFIRFNCDTNREEHGAKTSLEHKIQALLSCIGTQITRIRKNENTELCDIVKLFYCKSCSKNGSDICLCLPTRGPLVGVPQ